MRWPSYTFATTISPWVVTLDALAPFKCPTSAVVQDPVPLPYLRDPDYSSFDVSTGGTKVAFSQGGTLV